MRTFYWITGYLTLPGALLRAFLEHLTLRLLRLPVEDTACLQRNELFGHVEHKPAETVGQNAVLCIVPSVLTLLFGLLFFVPAALQLFYMGVTPVTLETGGVSAMFIFCVVLYYLGVSCLCHVNPTYEDALYFAEAVHDAKLPAKILLFVPMALARAFAFLTRFGVFVIFWIAATAALIVL